MEPYKAKKMPFDLTLTNELTKLLFDATEKYGEFKGFLKNMRFDYKYYLENLLISDLYYSFKIDGEKINKEDMFYTPYMKETNAVIQFNNLKLALYHSINNLPETQINNEFFHKINKIMFTNCKKDNKTKGSGKFRKYQTYILKPGIAGSSVSFIPPVYTEVNESMKNLCKYINETKDNYLLATILTHYQYQKIHPYVSGNGKMGRLFIPIQFSYYKNEPPILFISESIEHIKNTYFNMMSGEMVEDINGFVKQVFHCIMEQCTINIKRIKKLNKVYKNDYDSFKEKIGGTTIYKVYPVIVKKIVFTTNDIVKETNLHINSVNKVLNKLVETGYLIKEKKKGTNRVTFCYKNMFDIYCK